MRVTVSFQLKKSKSRADGICPVYGRCTMNGQRFEIPTGFFYPPRCEYDKYVFKTRNHHS